jgi:hypothetical protein
MHCEKDNSSAESEAYNSDESVLKVDMLNIANSYTNMVSGITGANPLTPTNSLRGLGSGMTEASPVTTIHETAWQTTSWPSEYSSARAYPCHAPHTCHVEEITWFHFTAREDTPFEIEYNIQDVTTDELSPVPLMPTMRRSGEQYQFVPRVKLIEYVE